MLRTLLIATALLSTSGTALASGGYSHGRVISVEPHFSISFGTRHHDGFRVMYESGGHHYWTHTIDRPSHYFVLPPHHEVYYEHPGRHHGGKGHDRHHGKVDHGDRHDDRHDRRESRRHDRH